MIKLRRQILAAIACWEIAAFSGYADYAGFAGAGGFIVFWLLGALKRRPATAARDTGEPEDDARATTPAGPTIDSPEPASDRTSIW